MRYVILMELCTSCLDHDSWMIQNRENKLGFGYFFLFECLLRVVPDYYKT